MGREADLSKAQLFRKIERLRSKLNGTIRPDNLRIDEHSLELSRMLDKLILKATKENERL